MNFLNDLFNSSISFILLHPGNLLINLPISTRENMVSILSKSISNLAKIFSSELFAFITFSSVREANNSLDAHGYDMHGRSMVVRIAKPR